VLPLYEGAYPTDKRPRHAIEAARRYARGEIDEAAGDAAVAAARAAEAAGDAAARAEARAAAWAAEAAGDAAARAEARNVEKSWQLDRLAARLSDPEPEDWPCPAQIIQPEA
jgi:hypothetical protein